MTRQIPEIESQLALRHATTRADALAVLSGSPKPRLFGVLAIFCAGLSPVALSGFDAPLGVKLLLIVPFTASVIGAIELWSLRRRLEAAIALLKTDARAMS